MVWVIWECNHLVEYTYVYNIYTNIRIRGIDTYIYIIYTYSSIGENMLELIEYSLSLEYTLDPLWIYELLF